jgi:hypothetical protein
MLVDHKIFFYTIVQYEEQKAQRQVTKKENSKVSASSY